MCRKRKNTVANIIINSSHSEFSHHLRIIKAFSSEYLNNDYCYYHHHYWRPLFISMRTYLKWSGQSACCCRLAMVVILMVLDDTLAIDSIFARKSIFAASKPTRPNSIGWCHHQELIEENSTKKMLANNNWSNFHLVMFVRRRTTKNNSIPQRDDNNNEFGETEGQTERKMTRNSNRSSAKFPKPPPGKHILTLHPTQTHRHTHTHT